MCLITEHYLYCNKCSLWTEVTQTTVALAAIDYGTNDQCWILRISRLSLVASSKRPYGKHFGNCYMQLSLEWVFPKSHIFNIVSKCLNPIEPCQNIIHLIPPVIESSAASSWLLSTFRNWWIREPTGGVDYARLPFMVIRLPSVLIVCFVMGSFHRSSSNVRYIIRWHKLTLGGSRSPNLRFSIDFLWENTAFHPLSLLAKNSGEWFFSRWCVCTGVYLFLGCLVHFLTLLVSAGSTILQRYNISLCARSTNQVNQLTHWLDMAVGLNTWSDGQDYLSVSWPHGIKKV